MDILVIRNVFTPESTGGIMLLYERFFAYTLEDTVRGPGVKVDGKTAIPAGIYDLSVTFSPRFQRDMPLLSGVPGFSGIRIHGGNTAKDTSGCILIAKHRAGDNTIYKTQEKNLMRKLIASGDNTHRIEIIESKMEGRIF